MQEFTTDLGLLYIVEVILIEFYPATIMIYDDLIKSQTTYLFN